MWHKPETETTGLRSKSLDFWNVLIVINVLWFLVCVAPFSRFTTKSCKLTKIAAISAFFANVFNKYPAAFSNHSAVGWEIHIFPSHQRLPRDRWLVSRMHPCSLVLKMLSLQSSRAVWLFIFATIIFFPHIVTPISADQTVEVMYVRDAQDFSEYSFTIALRYHKGTWQQGGRLKSTSSTSLTHQPSSCMVSISFLRPKLWHCSISFVCAKVSQTESGMFS